MQKAFRNFVALMENPTVKCLRLSSVNSIFLGDLSRQCEAAQTLNDTSLSGQQPGKVKIISPNEKWIFNGVHKK